MSRSPSARRPSIGRPGATVAAALALLTACSGGGDGGSAEPAAPTGQACEQLVGLTIPAASIGLPTGGGRVTSATVVAASGTGVRVIPEHCLVNGTVAPVDPAAEGIAFRVALPTSWNRKVMMFGGGGFNGSIPNVLGNVPAGPADQPLPIGRGYAVFASNGGHQAGALGSLDGSFLLNEEMLRNWTGEALKKTRDAATFVVNARYATKIEKAYFAGGSTGGREALQVATRWPDDWNGIIAWYPAWKQMSAILAGHRMNRALARPGAYPNQAKRLLVYNAALAACDALDGVADGIIANQNRCNALFDPATATLNGTPLRCPDGVDAGDSCLSDAQITGLKALNVSTRFNFTLASGETGYPGYNVWGADLGIASTSALQPTVLFLNLNLSQPSFPMPSTAPYISRQTDALIRYGITRDLGFDSLSLDPENPGPWGPRISEISTLLDVPVNLDAFAAKGGRLLLAHGLSDVLVSSRGTEEYYQRLRARMGPAEVEKFVRYYEAPSYGHAVTSQFNVSWDSLTALENWAEKGSPPPPQVMGDTASGVIARTRPLCEYPRWSRYNGSGDVNAAASFSCVPYEDVSPTQRSTHLGAVIGTDHSASSGTYSWKGIPFARAPVGDLRWKAPVEPAAWTTPRFAQSFGNACSSAGRLYGPGLNNRFDASVGSTLGQTVGSEDCLYLNIWRPASAATRLPVMVFVHGGSNITGYTADPAYDFAALARTANAVVVSVNYRLGVLGFFNLGQLKTGANVLDDSGNFAILDIVKALQFVNRNIAGFGGDAANVTLMGHSAGAVNVFAVVTSPLVVNASPALVHKWVPMSGGAALASELPAGSLPGLARAVDFRGQADFLLNQLVIADGLAADATAAAALIASKTPAEVAAYLRGKSADAIWQAVVTRLAPVGAGGSGPIPEGSVVATSPMEAIRAGRYVKGPVLMSNTRDEGKLFPTLLPRVGGVNGRLINDATVFSIAFQYQPERPPQTTLEQWIPASYLPVTTPVTGWNAKTEELNAAFFLAGRDVAMAALRTQQSNIWYWRFDWDDMPAPFNDIFGAAHGFDLPFAFGNLGPWLYANISYTQATLPGRQSLSDAMMRSLGAFARNGDPNHFGLGVTWPTWPARLLFDATASSKVISVQ